MGGKILDRAANIAIITTCVAVVAVLWIRFSPTAGPSRPASAEARDVPLSYKPGEHLDDVPDSELSRSDYTLVLILQSQCRFCRESMDFYRELARRRDASRGVLTLGVLMPDDGQTARTYLKANGVAPNFVVARWSSRSRRVVTPTVLLVDRTGTLKAAWTGRMGPQAEGELLTRLETAIGTGPATR